MPFLEVHNSTKNRVLIPMYFQKNAPQTTKIGALWVEMDAYPVGKIMFSDSVAPHDIAISNGDIVIVIDNIYVDLKFGSKKLMRFSRPSIPSWDITREVSSNMPSGVHHRENGIWKSKNTRYWNGNAWVLITLGDGYIYKDGLNVGMTKGYVSYTSHTKYEENADHIYLYAKYSDGSSSISTETKLAVDLTNIKKIYVEWAGIGSYAGYSYVGIQVDLIGKQSFSQTGRTAAFSSAGVFPKRVDSLDVSSVSGRHYVSFHARDVSSHSGNVTESILKIYKIWFE